MKRPLQVFLDAEEFARLEAWADARGWTKSQAIRAAVRALTREPAGDDILALSGMVHGLPADVSQSFDRHLEETFVAEQTPRYGARPRTRRPRIRR